MADTIFVTESPVRQPVGAAVAYTFDFSDIGTPADAGAAAAYDATGATVTSTILSGSNTLSGNTIISKVVTPASAQVYLLTITAVIGGQTFPKSLEVRAYTPQTAITITNGYATLLECKDYGVPEGHSDRVDDAVAAAMIEGICRDIDALCLRTFYARTETRYYDLPADGGRSLILDDDLISITTLTNGDATVITSASYNLFPRNSLPKREIRLKESASIIWAIGTSGDTEAVISVAGSWGWAAAVPVNIREAVKETFKLRYSRRFGAETETNAQVTPAGIVITPRGAFPKGVYQTLMGYKRML